MQSDRIQLMISLFRNVLPNHYQSSATKSQKFSLQVLLPRHPVHITPTLQWKKISVPNLLKPNIRSTKNVKPIYCSNNNSLRRKLNSLEHGPHSLICVIGITRTHCGTDRRVTIRII